MRRLPRQIAAHVAAGYDLGLAALAGRCRDRRHVVARHEAMYVLRQATRLSSPAIGALFQRHHNTVLYGCRQVEGRMMRDPQYVGRVAALIVDAMGAADG